MAITTDEDVLHGLPRIEGTRISVLHIYDVVVKANVGTAEVADSLDLTLGQVYEALAYYYNHPDEMRRHREAQSDALAALDERVVKPPVEVDRSGSG